MSPMLKNGDIIDLEIQSLANGGEGVARQAGRVIFVEGALPAEKVRAKITSVKKNFARAQMLEVTQASPHRVKPPCPHFGRCGGCALQHLDYAQQPAAKRQILEDVFRYLGGMRDAVIEPVIASPQYWNYRNHVTLNIRPGRDRLRFGFVAKDNTTLIPIEECPIADTRINQLIARLNKESVKMPEAEQQGLRRFILRAGTEGEALSAAVKKSGMDKEGEAVLSARVEGKDFAYSMESFFQTNYSLLPRMIAVMREMLAPKGREALLDLYAGAGFFSVLFAADYEQVLAIEEGRQAASGARENFARNNITNARMIAGRVEEKLQEERARLGSPLHVILDPPRQGLPEEVADLLCAVPAERMLYVSCEPSVLVRDLKRLSKSYAVKRVVPLDMFPQTPHLETLVLLERITPR